MLHDCKIALLNCGQIFASLKTFGIKHTGSFICFVTPFMFELSRVTRNHWHSLDNVYSHKCCPSETCVYVLQGMYNTLSRDTSLISDNDNRFGSI